MTTVINFKCGACGKPYSVQPEHAGREFACKQCGTRLCVPQPGKGGTNVDAQVEMGSGSEVMRKTTASGRQVPTDPTRVFKKHRETSARMVAVPAQTQAVEKKSSKLPLIIVVVVLLLAGGGAAAAFAMGVFDSGNGNGGKQTAGTNTPTPEGNGKSEEPSERAEIFAELESIGSDSAKLIALYQRGEKAGLEQVDLATIGRKVVSAMIVDRGGALADADLLGFAGKLEAIDEPGEAIEVYEIVIHRHRGSNEPPESVTQAHKALGHHYIEFTPEIMRAADLRDYGVQEDLGALHDELVEMDKLSDNGWVQLPDKNRFDQIVKRLDETAAEIERMKTENPFQLQAALTRRDFASDPISSRGEWTSMVNEPYVVFVQLQSNETAEEAEERVESAIKRLDQFAAYFEQTFAEPLGLTRTMPGALEQAEREIMPYEILLFRDPSYWQRYLNDYSEERLDAQNLHNFMEPGSGRASMVYRDEWETARDSTTLTDMVRFRWMLAEQAIFCHHPSAPQTKKEAEDFDIFRTYLFRAHLIVAMTREDVTPGVEKDTYEYFVDDGDPARRLKLWNRPTAIADNNNISAFGGPAFTVQDLVKASSFDATEDIMRERLSGYDGWNEDALFGILTDRNRRIVFGAYLRGFFDFIWNWPSGESEPKYRAKFLQFLKSDLNGEVDPDDPSVAFAEAFGLGEDWSDIEQDWLAYQTAE